MKKAFIVTIAILLAANTYAQITGQGGYLGTPGFDRGFQSTCYCGNNPESWVRGSAFLNTQNGFLTMYVNLETDATHAGPTGQVEAYIYDCYGNLLTRVSSANLERGGKAPGRAESSTFQATFNLGPNIGGQACSVWVVAKCTGSSFRFWNVSLDQVKDAMGLIQQFAIFFF